MKIVLLCGALFFASCRVPGGQQNLTQPPTDAIYFVVLKMARPAGGKATVELLKKIETAGTLKEKPYRLPANGSYLTVLVYHGKQLLDSVRTEHPLNKRFEYIGEGNRLALKDTVLAEAGFFIRFGSNGRPDRLVIKEKTEQRPSTEIATIKLR